MWGVQLPGRETRFNEDPCRRMSDLVTPLARALLPHTDVPLVLFGHSMGALVGFALSRELRRLQAPAPARLIVSSHLAPDQPDYDPPIHDWPHSEFLDAVGRLSGDSAAMPSEELVELLLPSLRADFELCETYEYTEEAPLECPISAFCGMDDQEITRKDLLEWKKHTRAQLTIDTFPGGHFYWRDNPDALFGSLTRVLREMVDGAD